MPANRTWRDRRAAAGLLLGRLLLAFIFIHEGWTIIGNYGVAAAYMQRFGVPAILLPAVIALELGGGLLIAAGAFTRILAPAFAIFCMLTAVLFHAQLVDANQLLHLQKDLAIAGGFLVLAVSGPGSLSADRCLGLSSGGVDGGATQEGARRVEYPLGDLLCLGVGADRRPNDDHDLLVLGGPLDEAERDAASRARRHSPYHAGIGNRRGIALALQIAPAGNTSTREAAILPRKSHYAAGSEKREAK